MKTYKETKAVITAMVKENGIDSITGYDIANLLNNGHTGTNIQNAMDYFKYSPKASKYRN